MTLLDESTFIVYREELLSDGPTVVGVDVSKIVEIPNFVDEDTRLSMLEYLKSETDWGGTAFEGAEGAPPGYPVSKRRPEPFGLDENAFSNVNDRLGEAVKMVFNKDVSPSSIHAQRWQKGALANPHSDNTDASGKLIEDLSNLKYVGILYLNDDYSGGELYFPDHKIEIKPNPGSMYIFSGGTDNVHGVREITNGTRYSIVSFWTF